MPCVVEICFPIRDSACILVRSKLVKSQEEKKQRLGQIEESKSETKDERHFLPKTLSCHQLLMPCQCSPSISPQNAQGPFFCVKLVNCFFLVVCFSNPALSHVFQNFASADFIWGSFSWNPYARCISDLHFCSHSIDFFGLPSFHPKVWIALRFWLGRKPDTATGASVFPLQIQKTQLKHLPVLVD